MTGKRLHNILTALFCCMIITSLFSGCASSNRMMPQDLTKAPPAAAEEEVVKELPVLRSLELTKDAVTVSAEEPFSYSLPETDDPFKLVVELDRVMPGRYSGEMLAGEGVVSEARVSLRESPEKGTVISLLLASPVKMQPDYSDGVLTLTAHEAALFSPPEEEVIEEPEVVSEAGEGQTEDIALTDLDEEALSAEREPLSPEEATAGEAETEAVDLSAVAEAESVGEETADEAQEQIQAEPVADELQEVLANSPDLPEEVPGIPDEEGTPPGEDVLIQPEDEEAVDLSAVAEAESVEEETADKVQEQLPSEPAVRRIDLDFHDADILHIFRFFADVSGFNIVIDPRVKGKISMKLVDVPWTQALDIMLKTHNLGKIVEDNIIRIAPLATILKEKEAEVKIESAEQLAEPLVTKVFLINFSDVNTVKDSILQSGILTERGRVSADERVSSLIVKDIETSMPEIENLVKVLDRATKQVLIEARIVEASDTATSEIGIQWGGGVFGNDKTEFYGGNANLNTGTTSSFPFIVDFPTSLSTSSRGAGLRFGFLNPTGTIGLDIQLSMLEATGMGKVISRPRVMTLDNKEAMIAQGDQIPVRTTTVAEGVTTTSVEFKDVRLELKVKPHITPDDHISMEVMITKNEAKTSTGTVDDPSAIITNEASTNVIIRSGMTIVIGGIHKTKKEDATSGIPVLSRIPVIGNIFKYHKKIDNTTELLIFITPSVVESG